MIGDDLCFAPAVELAEQIRKRSISVVEMIDTFLVRIDEVNAILNAYINADAEAARAQAITADNALTESVYPGPLHGIPVAIKDLIYTAGIRTTASSAIYVDFIPGKGSIVVSRLKAAGAIVLRKTNTPEFGFKSTTEKLLFGATNNLWDLSKTAGGSSGGARAGTATAAGIAPLSIGTDAGGSIRTPSSFCGIFGFKPTFSRVPSAPGFGGGRSISHTGPMTRCVANAAMLMDVIAEPDECDRYRVPTAATSFVSALTDPPEDLKIGWSSNLGYTPVDGEVAALTEAAVTTFVDIGWEVDKADPEFADPNNVFNTIIRAERYIAAKDLLDFDPDKIDPGLREFTNNGARISAFDDLQAQSQRDYLCARLARYFERYDLLVTPTLAVSPFVLGTRPDRISDQPIHGMSWVAFTYPFNLTVSPEASVPCRCTAQGLPVGLQIIGPRFAVRLVLQASAAFEMRTTVGASPAIICGRLSSSCFECWIQSSNE
jgi:aspartyl-tRNA(Asn)/glutamyl-tRNA(Gln) amidotransferase subunit A